MFTKIKGKTFLYFIFLLALFFTSCVNENLDKAFDIEDSNKGMFELPLEISLPYQDTIKTKSAATATELTIKDAYVLFFNSSNKYVSGTALTIASHITGNGTTTPKIKFPFKGSLSGVTKAVVLFNTGYTSATIPLTTSNTINDISTKFPSTNWGINTTTKGLPMSGTATVSNGVAGACTVTRVVSKVSVSTASLNKTVSGSIGNAPISITLNSFTWKLCNYTERGRIYEDGSTVTYAFTNSGYLAVNTVARYLAQYTNSTKAGTITVGSTVFNKNRTCVILKANVTENGTTKDCYYRLDFFNASKYIDINRNTNYTFSIKSIKSRGYSSEAEALANPGGNVDYTLAEGSGSQSVNFSNGQYIVLADKHIVYVDDSYTVSTAKNLMSVRFLSNGTSNPNFNKNISTRTVELVGADKKTRVSTDVMQLCNSAGTAASGNILTLGVDDGVSAAYMLKVKTNQSTLGKINLGTIFYIKISYGNIVGYIPIGVVFFDVKINSTDWVSAEGGSRTITVTSRKYCPASIYETVNIAEPWTLSNSSPYETGNINLYTSKILTGVVTSGNGNRSFNVTLPYNEYKPYKRVVVTPSAGTAALREKEFVNTRVDLSYSNADIAGNANVFVEKGKRSTANCYIVNGPGNYQFPLVMGNGIKNGVTNTSAFKRGSGDRILANFLDYKGNAISSPWLSGVNKLEILWSDWPNLITDLFISGNYTCCFTVPKENICEGNALICAKDANGTIMWSWHIWVTNYQLGYNTTPLFNQKDVMEHIMPYELGFVDETKYTEGEMQRGVYLTFNQTSTSTKRSVYVRQQYYWESRDRYSYKYTWGRKDPYTNIEPLVWKKFTYPTAHRKIYEYIQNPCLQTDNIDVDINDGSSSWYDNAYVNLWDNDTQAYYTYDPNYVPYTVVRKTIYDPCPVGFTVPNRYAFTGLVTKSTFLSYKQNTNGNSVPSWGTVYSMANKSQAIAKGVNVVTDFTRGSLFDNKNFVMKDNKGSQITFHLDCGYNVLGYHLWTAGVSFSRKKKHASQTFSIEDKCNTASDGTVGDVVICPGGYFYLSEKFGRGEDGMIINNYQFPIRPAFELVK